LLTDAQCGRDVIEGGKLGQWGHSARWTAIGAIIPSRGGRG